MTAVIDSLTDPQTDSAAVADGLAQEVSALQLDTELRTVRVADQTLAFDTAGELRRELGTALYRLWHSGSHRGSGPLDLRRDLEFEARLLDATAHRTSRTPAVVRSAPLDGPFGRHALFDVGRVRLRIAAEAVPDPLPEVGTRVTLELPAVRPTLSPGFFLVNGSAGGPALQGHVLRLYVHVDEASMAPTVWQAVIGHLERHEASYRAKVLAKAAGYPRRDAIVIYLSRESWDHAHGVARAVAGLPGVSPERSLLAAPLADGVSALAYAWDPRDSRPGWNRMSFGQHRTAVVAEAIAEHLFHDVALDSALAAALVGANIDPRAPHRNADSPDWPHLGGEDS